MDDKGKLKSTASFCGMENTDIRNILKGMGYSDDDLAASRPIIGIANSWNTLTPGHSNFNQISEQVKKGIHRAGGTAFEFGTIGLCDGVVKNNFNYVLPSREIICDSVETMGGANPLDGLILLASCDKIVPGMLMAAARLDVPAILVNSGPMLGRHRLRRPQVGCHHRIGGLRHVQDRGDFDGGLSQHRRPFLSDLRLVLLHGHGQHHGLPL